ncbi:hypothetical protein ES332_D13G132500v1 [Gossypium tomentosum]|uniref:Uncharacterized protein n=1 Tax=Gossypium tomentosum TaxID=34277 RepID=A0A5D2HWG4_GOSTO|nr:hypothetical protein ES332_D13G132500v1 [Gossypium tomentosum]
MSQNNHRKSSKFQRVFVRVSFVHRPKGFHFISFHR